MTAYANENVVVGMTGSAPTASASAGSSLFVAINNVDIGAVVSQGDLQKDRTSTIDAINNFTGQTGVVATDNGEGITLTAADGRNISVNIGDTGTGIAAAGEFGLDSSVVGIGNSASSATNFATGAETTYSTVRLESATTIDIEAGTNGTTGLSDSGFTRGEYGGGEDGTLLSDVDISTFEGRKRPLPLSIMP